MFRFLPAILLILAVSGCGADDYHSDEFIIRGHLNIPTTIPMTLFFATPQRSSAFFGRENLLIKAKFKFKDQKEFDDYLAIEQVVQNWNALPVPDKYYMRMEEFDRFQQADLKQIDQMRDGYWLCETTAGQGFSAPKSVYVKCPPAEPNRDFLIAAVDKETLELYVVVKQDY